MKCIESASIHSNGGNIVSFNDVSYGSFRLRTAIRAYWNGLTGFQCIPMENGVSHNDVSPNVFFLEPIKIVMRGTTVLHCGGARCLICYYRGYDNSLVAIISCCYLYIKKSKLSHIIQYTEWLFGFTFKVNIFEISHKPLQTQLL